MFVAQRCVDGQFSMISVVLPPAAVPQSQWSSRIALILPSRATRRLSRGSCATSTQSSFFVDIQLRGSPAELQSAKTHRTRAFSNTAQGSLTSQCSEPAGPARVASGQRSASTPCESVARLRDRSRRRRSCAADWLVGTKVGITATSPGGIDSTIFFTMPVGSENLTSVGGNVALPAFFSTHSIAIGLADHCQRPSGSDVDDLQTRLQHNTRLALGRSRSGGQADFRSRFSGPFDVHPNDGPFADIQIRGLRRSADELQAGREIAAPR